LTDMDKRLTKGGAAACSGTRPQTTQQAKPEQKRAPSRTQKGPITLQLPSSDEQRGVLRSISGSDNDDFSTVLVNQIASALLQGACGPKQRTRLASAMLAPMTGMKPRDELEGMLIAQAIASHNAAMECYRRAMMNEQTFEGRHENLKQAEKLSRTYAALVEALDRHRGKGQQRITVEHVNVQAGGQAIVGSVTSGGGTGQEAAEETNATRGITHEPGTPMWSPDAERELMPVPGSARKAPV